MNFTLRLVALLAWSQPACGTANNAPPQRRTGPDLQRLLALERQFAAEGPILRQRLAAEAALPNPGPISRELKRLEEVLASALAAPDAAGLCRLHHAVLEHDAMRVRALVSAGAAINVRAGDSGVLPLHLAVLAGDRDPQCLQELLDGGADVDAADANGVTGLHAACSLNMPRVTTMLLAAGAVSLHAAAAAAAGPCADLAHPPTPARRPPPLLSGQQTRP